MYLDFLTLPENGPPSFKEEFYSFEYGDALFLMLKSDPQARSSEIEKWIGETLANSNKTWKIAVMHYPVWPVARQQSDVPAGWLGIFEAAQVDLILCGHDHVYMRTNQAASITQVLGNSGSKMYQTNRANRTHIYVDIENVATYSIMDVTSTSLRLTTYDVFGTALDVFTLTPQNRNLSDEQFVTRLYNGLLGRNPDQSGLEFWMTHLRRGISKTAIFNAFVSSAEFTARMTALGLVA